MTDEMDPSKVYDRSRKARAAIYEKKEDEALDSPLHRFSIDMEDSRGKRYKGDFVFKVPNIGDQVSIASMKSMYLPNGAAADPNGAFLAEMICTLEVCLQEKPKWWKPHLFYDADVISEVYRRCTAFERKFLGRDANVGESTEESPSEAEDREGDDPVHQGAVDGDVQPAGQRREVLTPNRS